MKKTSPLVSYAFLAPALIVLGTFAFYPMLRGLWLSLYSQSILGAPEWIGLENFRDLWGDDAFRTALGNSLKYLLVVPVIAALSLALALLVEPKMPAMPLFRALFYIPVVTTMIVVGITWKSILREDGGVLNTALMNIGLIEAPIYWLTSTKLVLFSVMAVTAWKGLGYYMVIFLAGLQSIPPQQIEAAGIDGAKWWQVILHIKIPALRPTLHLVILISSIAAIQVFEEIYIMTKGGPLDASSTVVFQIWKTGFDVGSGRLDLGYAAAMGVVLFVMLVVLTTIATWLMKRSEAKA